MKTSHGVIQGYTGVAAVDSKHQVVLHAEAFGQGQEHGLLEPMIEGVKAQFSGVAKEEIEKSQVTADSGYHNQATLTYLETQGIDAYIADTGFRSRDPRFKDHKRPKARNRRKEKTRFTQDDFIIDRKNTRCHCPAGVKRHPILRLTRHPDLRTFPRSENSVKPSRREPEERIASWPSCPWRSV